MNETWMQQLEDEIETVLAMDNVERLKHYGEAELWKAIIFHYVAESHKLRQTK